MVENIKLFKKLVSEDNIKKMAKKAADAAIEDIKDQYYDYGYYDRDEVYYTLKRNWQAQGLRHDNDPVFAAAFDIVNKWVKKNIK